MEKYYLASLTNSPGSNVDLRRKVKLVEIHYARRPPSFGLVYFSQEGAEQKPATVQLACLEISDNNVARFCTTRSVEFGNLLGASRLVDFDTSQAILMEPEGGGGGGSRSSGGSQPASCIALAQDGSLFNVRLADGSVNSITSGCDLLKRRLNEGQFIQCQLQQPSQLLYPGPQVTDAECYIHLLAEKVYSLHRLSKCTLQLIQKYSIMPSEWSYRHFKSLLVMGTNFQVVIVELNDSSLRILQQVNCLATLNQADLLGPNQRHLLSMDSSNNDNEAILLSYGRSHIVAHSLLVGESGRPSDQAANQPTNKLQDDPDKLLPREPSFELDKCWSIDLDDIDSIRCLDEEDEELERNSSRGCLCPMWSTTQLNPDDSMAKFLVVAHKFHLLVYTFEQRPSLPFSVVYDRSFLRDVQPQLKDANSNPLLRGNSSGNEFSEYLDPRLRPRLVHNFKLIGAHPSDALFNGLFLAPGAHLAQARHFAQLGLLIGITNSGDLLAFKCVTSQVTVQRNSLYQQLVASSIRGPSLLASQIELMQSSNRLLQQDITSLGSKSRSGKQQSEQQLNRFLRTELRRRDDIGCLYNLSLSLSNLVQVTRVVVLSAVNSFILAPLANPLIKSVYIDNRITMKDNNKPGPVLMANISSQKLSASVEELSRTQSWDEEPIYNCTILDLWSRQHTQKASIDLPVYIMDGQCGHLRVLYVLDNSKETLHSGSIKTHLISMGEMQTNRSSDNNNNQESHGETIARVYSTSLPIRALMSYQSTDLATISGDALMSCQFAGNFSKEKLLSWLSECFHSPAGQFNGRFRSAFTHCSLEYEIKDNQATIMSDDLIAMELIKRQVLKQATDDSTRLEISHSTPTTSHLRHLIGLQHTNLCIASKLSNVASAFSNQSSDIGGDLLLESLISEINFCQLPVELGMESDNLVESMRNDIKSLPLSKSDNQFVEPTSEGASEKHDSCEKSSLNDLVCGFIIDALVDFDKLHGWKPVNEMMILMRFKLVDILSGLDKLDKNSFSNTILTNWNEIKRNSMNPLK